MLESIPEGTNLGDGFQAFCVGGARRFERFSYGIVVGGDSHVDLNSTAIFFDSMKQVDISSDGRAAGFG